VNAALVITYLEMHHPSPPPESGRRYGLPVEVNFARMADELAVDRRTLGIALLCVSTWFEDERVRLGAVRAGREFLNLKHSRFAKLKLYSIVAPRAWRSLETLTLRRNWPQLTRTLEECRVTPNVSHETPCGKTAAVLPRLIEHFAAARPSSLQTLPEILMRGVELAQDRRKTRYVRLRRAMKHDPEPPEVVKVQRKPSADDKALDTALGDDLVARLSRSLR
jgi:hypothetical protein